MLAGLEDSQNLSKVRVAIIGDPHFFRESEDGSRAAVSHIRLNQTGEFITDQSNQNPWSGLRSLIASEQITADVLVCAGDLTYSADQVGLKKAWIELVTLAHELKVDNYVCATGNHDVSSRSMATKVGKNPTRELSAAQGIFEPLKLLVPPYPVVRSKNNSDAELRLLRTKYFGDGLVLVEADRHRLVVVNSCCEHSSDSFQHERGSFPKSAQQALIHELAQSTDEKINILVAHHPPEPHSEHDLGGHDFIENGEALLQCLEEHGSWFVIHGHKHHGRITRAKGTASAPIVFSAASLGIKLDLAKEGMRNQFYCVDIYQSAQAKLFGTVRAWDFNVGVGWKNATPALGGIYDGCGFGNTIPIDELAHEISSYAPCTWLEVVRKSSSVEFLTPSEMRLLQHRLAKKHKIIIQSDPNGYWLELLKEIS